MVDDFESQRSNSLRWLCGQPTDALLFVLASGKTVLVPWDINLANDLGVADQIIPYTDFKRSFREAVIGVLRAAGLPQKAGGPRETDPASDQRPRVAFPARTSHLRYLELSGDLPGALVEATTPGFESFITEKRNVKDPSEIAVVRRAADITNELVDLLEEIVRGSGDGLRELEMAQIIEREALARGAEGLGFETLAAGPARSWAIHPFPAYSNSPFGGPGFSILDFGVRVDGYTSDVTMTFIRGSLSAEQERMVSLVEQAYTAAMGALRSGVSCREPALRADEVFSAAGQKMPHSLGHGIGLDTHESPVLRT
ncbi:MAG TPA: M24 family metallopeptidase, partial [Spirochaetia bacterium]|nr:M24 family metallopeptidase [Spirochaetia bacterium]